MVHCYWLGTTVRGYSNAQSSGHYYANGNDVRNRGDTGIPHHGSTSSYSSSPMKKDWSVLFGEVYLLHVERKIGSGTSKGSTDHVLARVLFSQTSQHTRLV